jgi:ribonuclease H2 subunit B
MFRSELVSVKVDGTLGSFRPADDMLEQAATQLVNAGSKNKDPSMTLSEKDLRHFSSLQCVQSALKRLCDVKGSRLCHSQFISKLYYFHAEITPEIVVYRYSMSKLVDYLRLKVTRLATTEMLECSRTLIRGLAKDGLMEDGKEYLLECLCLLRRS